MSAEIILQQPPDVAALLASIQDKRSQLASIRVALAERESELAQLRARLRTFESRYFRQVGSLYAQLDDIEARIAEREVDLYDSNSARNRAREARRRAQETQNAALGEDATEAEEFDLPPSLKTLFRDLARRIHPDFARDEPERRHFTLLMARANYAYRSGDAETLQRLLDDHREVQSFTASASTVRETASAELFRIARQIQHAERDIASLDAEQHSLLASEIAQLFLDAEIAAAEHRDLLAELAAAVRERIANANHRLEFVDRQVWTQRGAGFNKDRLKEDESGKHSAHG